MGRFHPVYIFEYFTNRIHAVWVRLTKIEGTSRPENIWPEIRSSMSKKSQQTEKQHWTEEKPKLDNARKLRGFYFVDPDDEEFNETLKHARKRVGSVFGFCNAV